MTGWQLFSALTDGTVTGELTTATDREYVWKLNDYGTASFSLACGEGDQTDLVSDLASDVVVTFNGQSKWRGRVTGTHDDFTADGATVGVGCKDYRGMLGHRFAMIVPTWPSTDTAEAAWRLVNHTQTFTSDFVVQASPLGIGKGSVDAISTRDIDLNYGVRISEAIDDLAGIWPGFDWWIGADMQFNARPRRGTSRDFALIYGDTVTDASCTFDPDGFANCIIQTGKDGLYPWVSCVPSYGPEGRWEMQIGNPDLIAQSSVIDSSTRALSRFSSPQPSWSVTLAPGVWTPDDLWVGDLVRLVVHAGRKSTDSFERVLEVKVTDDGDGTPVVSMVISNDLHQSVAAWLRTGPARLTQLARR